MPLPGTTPEMFGALQVHMPLCLEITVVFEDTRSTEEARSDIDMNLKRLSASQQTSRAERSYAKAYAKIINDCLTWANLRCYHFHFAVVEKPEKEFDVNEALQHVETEIEDISMT